MSLRASVVVVSRERPRLLARCVKALALQDHPAFEVVVVADPAGLAAVAGAPVKRVGFDAPNISAARNLGIAAAAGAVVAFIDDDAVAEPAWLSRLCAPLADPGVAAAGGFVRGRNGISFQWQGRLVAPDGFERDIPDWGPEARLFPPPGGAAVKLQGTNMAFRRDALLRHGGFDPALRYYLDETDLCLRLARAGEGVALVPLAEVQHGMAAGPHRGPGRVPLSLHEIGASLATFLRRHAPEDGAALAAHRLAQRRRLVGMMVEGRVEPRDVPRLMASFDAGVAEGAGRPLALPALAPADPPAFLPYPAPRQPGRLLAGRIWQARRLRAEAADLAARGVPVTLILLSPSARPHRMGFTDGGWWEQRGGLFGRSLRAGPRLVLASFSARVAREAARMAPVRPAQSSAAAGGGGRHGNAGVRNDS